MTNNPKEKRVHLNDLIAQAWTATSDGPETFTWGDLTGPEQEFLKWVLLYGDFRAAAERLQAEELDKKRLILLYNFLVVYFDANPDPKRKRKILGDQAIKTALGI